MISVLVRLNSFQMSKLLPDVDDRFCAGDVTGRVAFDLAQQIGVVELVAEVRTKKKMKKY